MSVCPLASRNYELIFERGKLADSEGVVIVESDFLSDTEIEAFLKKLPKFDAVTVWLIGTHGMRQECENIVSLGIRSDLEYRLRVQNKIYELADEILVTGGVLQIVDRGEVPNSDELRQDFWNAHCEQASVTSLKVTSFEYMIYKEPSDAGSLDMVASLGTSGRIPDLSQLAMTSTISIK
jgi:hypothetical protein